MPVLLQKQIIFNLIDILRSVTYEIVLRFEKKLPSKKFDYINRKFDYTGIIP